MTRKGDGQAEHTALARRLHATFVRMCSDAPHCTLLIVHPFEAEPSNGLRRITSGAANSALLARRLRALVRKTDEIHIDGERGIAVVLRGTGYRGGRVVMLRLARALDGSTLPVGGTFATGWRQNDIPWKLAIGCSEVTRQDLATPERLARAVARAWRPQETVVTATTSRRTPTYPPGISREMPTRFSYPPRRRITSVPLTATPARSPENARSGPLSQGRVRRTPPLRLIRGGKPRYSEETMRLHAQALGVPFLRLPRRLPGFAWHGISAELAHELRAVPVGCSQHVLTVAMDNPRDIGAVLRLRAITGLAIFPVLALPEELDLALDQIAE